VRGGALDIEGFNEAILGMLGIPECVRARGAEAVIRLSPNNLPHVSLDFYTIPTTGDTEAVRQESLRFDVLPVLREDPKVDAGAGGGE